MIVTRITGGRPNRFASRSRMAEYIKLSWLSALWVTALMPACLLPVTSSNAQPPVSKPPAHGKPPPQPAVRRPLPKLPNGARGFDTRRPPPDPTERLIAIGGGWGGGEEPERKLKNRTARGYYDLGHAFKNQADFGKAIPPLEAAIRLKPNYLAAYRDLGDSYAYQGSFAEEGSAAQQKLYRKAIAAFESARRLAPRADTSYNLGILYFDTAQYVKSIDAMHEGARLSTTHEDDFIPILEHSEPGDVYFFLGEAYRYLGQTSRAIASYKQVLSSEKTQHADRTRISLGNLYEELGQPQLALVTYVQYLESRDPKQRLWTTPADDADVFLKVGLIQAGSGKLEESAASFAQAAESAAKWIPEWESRLKTAPDAAAKRRLTALTASLKETLVQAAYNLGVARLALNQPAEAIEALSLALKRAPKHSASRYNLGLAYHRQGDKAAANEQLDRLRELDADLAKDLETLLNKTER